MPPGGNVGEALRYAPSGAGVLVEALRELATRGKRTNTSGTVSGEGAGARVAVRSVLEDHETAILELERQVCEVELLAELQDIAFKNKDRSLTIAELGMKLETRVERQVSVLDMLETTVQDTQQVVADLGSSFAELEDDLEMRVDEIAKSVLDASKELQVLARLHRRPRAVYKYWAQLMVWTSLRSRTTSSSSLRWTVDGASPQFLDRVVDTSVMLRDRYAQCQTVLFWTGY